jgi:hypothetical protein
MPIFKLNKSKKTQEEAFDYLSEFFEQVYELVGEEEENWVYQIDISSHKEKEIYDKIILSIDL